MLVLVDTSVWIDHFRNRNRRLHEFLHNSNVVAHPLIIGEIACGYLQNRVEILSLLQSLPQSIIVDHEEILVFIENSNLMGKGIGYIDVSILASAIVSGLPLWTLNQKLKTIAALLGVDFE